jgi:hypothetical protein
VLVVSQLATVERGRLRETETRLDGSVMAAIDEGLRLALGLSPLLATPYCLGEGCNTGAVVTGTAGPN